MKHLTGSVILLCAAAFMACSKEEPKTNTTAMKQDPKPAVATNVSQDENDPHMVKISVPTMQCETCANTIKKGLKTVSEAQDINVDVDSKTVFVKVANKSPETQHKLEEAIARTGYSTTSVTRDPKAYDGLPDCCKEGGHKE